MTVMKTASVEGVSVEIIDEFSHGNFQRLATSCVSASHLASTFRSQGVCMFKRKEGSIFLPAQHEM